MKTKYITLSIIAGIMIITGAALLNSCKVSEEIQAKSGSQLWGENCSRCHRDASPSDFSDAQWDIIGMHMRVRANFTAEEIQKIIEFLKTAN